MPASITSLRHFVQLLVKEIALCGEEGATPLCVVQNTFSTFSIEDLTFVSKHEPFELLRACWDPLTSLNGTIFFAHSWPPSPNYRAPPPSNLEDAINQNLLLFAESHVQLYALGARSWISSSLFSDKCILLLQLIAKAREKGVVTALLLRDLGFNSIDLHHYLEKLKSNSLITSRKCQVIIDGAPVCSSLWHLAFLPAASTRPITETYGGFQVQWHSIADEDLDSCVEILENAGGFLSVEDFVCQLGRHPHLKSKVSSTFPGTGYQSLEQALTQQRHVRRVLTIVPSSCQYKIPVLQIYDPSDVLLPETAYPFQLLPKIPLTSQVQSFIHDCGSYGCTSADITQRFQIPKKFLERILSQLSADEVNTTKQSIGKNQSIVYTSKVTAAKKCCVSKVVRGQAALCSSQQEDQAPDLPKHSFERPAPVVRQNVPWHQLDLNDLQLQRLDVIHAFLLLNPVVSVSLVLSHVLQQERLSKMQFKMSNKTFYRSLNILLPFIRSTHVVRTVLFGDGVSLRMLMPEDMHASDAAVVEAYETHRSLHREKRRKRLGLDLHLGVPRPQPSRSKRPKVESDVSATTHSSVRMRSKVSRATSADSAQDADSKDACNLTAEMQSKNLRQYDIEDVSDSSMEQLEPSHQFSYYRLLVPPSNFIKAYLLHSFIVNRRLSTVSVDSLLSMLPFKLLIQLIGIPDLKNDDAFSLFQELRTLPALAMNCRTLPREAVLNLHNKNKSGFVRVWKMLFNVSLLTLQHGSPELRDSNGVLSQEVSVSQSLVIQNMDSETYGNISNFGCVYYAPSLCVFPLRNSTDLRQLWMFFKHLAYDFDTDNVPNPRLDPSLFVSHELPDIIRYGGVFRYDVKAAAVRKRPSGWSLIRYSGPTITKWTYFIKNATNLQETLETIVFPHKCLTNILPQILVDEYYFGGLEIFVEYKKVSSSQEAQLRLLLDDQADVPQESEDVGCHFWNIDSESKLLAVVLLYYSDKMRPGRIPSGLDLQKFCNRVNWKLVSRFVREPAGACRNHFSQLVPHSQFAIALQAFRDQYPEPVVSRSLTAQMTQELANDIRVKILVYSDSFFWQQNGQGRTRDSGSSVKGSSKVNLPWHESFGDCVAASLVIKRTFCADHYDPSVAAAAKYIDSLLSPERIVIGTSCLSSFGATSAKLGTRSDKFLASQVLRWSDIPKVISEKLKVEKVVSNRLSLHEKVESFQSGVETLPSMIRNVNSGFDAAALTILHMQGLLSFEHEWHVTSQPAVHSKKVSMSDYLYNQGIFRLAKPQDKGAEAVDEGLDPQLSELDNTSRYMYHLNAPDIKLFKRRRFSIADFEIEPSSWKTDFPPEAVERASSFVHRQGAHGVDVRQVCDAVGVDVDDATAFRRYLLSGLLRICRAFSLSNIQYSSLPQYS
jgi:hypothetical protein